MKKTASIFAAVLWAGAGAAAPEKPALTKPAAPALPSAALPTPPRPEAFKSGANLFESPDAPQPENQIDQLVFARLATLGARPVLCSDAVFVRRAHVDAIGTLPTAQEARAFILDPDTKNKRRKLIDQLLEREEFADYWAMKWGDVLRIKAEFPVNLWPNAAQAYHRWVRASIAENKRYDKFVRELLTSSGSNFRVGPANFFRAIQNRTPEGITAAVALAFMGARTDAWPKERVDGMAAFFSQIGYKPTREWKEENVYWDPLGPMVAITNTVRGQGTNSAELVITMQPTNTIPKVGMFPDGTKVNLSPDSDPREAFANWLITPQNPWFARCAVNRVWSWLLGRGIIHEPDDIRADNPPSNPAVLAYLEQELVTSRCDLKRIYRLILNSKTYQMSSMPRYNTPQAEANFASYPLRRLDAEVLIDAINKVSGTTDLYISAIPEPFTYIPSDKPAIALPDGSISSPFLALFGRSARATGMENERINKQVSSQWLHLLNSSHIQKKIEQGSNFKAILESGRKPEAILEDLYLTILSRFPTDAEIQKAQAHGLLAAVPGNPGKGTYARGTSGKGAYNKGSSGKGTFNRDAGMKGREHWVDIIWSLINSTEFLYRH